MLYVFLLVFHMTFSQGHLQLWPVHVFLPNVTNQMYLPQMEVWLPINCIHILYVYILYVVIISGFY